MGMYQVEQFYTHAASTVTPKLQFSFSPSSLFWPLSNRTPVQAETRGYFYDELNLGARSVGGRV